MKRLWKKGFFVLAILLVLSVSTGVASAAPAGKPRDGWSSITIWAYIDNDLDGVISFGDTYLHDVSACLTHKQLNQTYCGGTDFGDVWWEPREGGTFVAWLDANDSDIPAGYTLASITCYNFGEQAPGQGCNIRMKKWEAQFKQVPGGLMNIYYRFTLEP